MHASWISVVWDVAQYNCQFVLHRLTAWDVPSYSRTSHLVQSIPFVWDGTSHLAPEHPICVRWDIPSYARASHSCEMGCPILCQSVPFMWDGMSHLVPEPLIHVRWDVPSCARTSHSCKMGRPIINMGQMGWLWWWGMEWDIPFNIARPLPHNIITSPMIVLISPLN